MGIKINAVLIMKMVVVYLLLITNAVAQEVNLDSYTKCGDLICYQALNDPNQYYYLPDQPRIAIKNGKPQFSFMKYVRNQSATEAGINQAQGGGLVHFLVTYGVTRERIDAAKAQLQEKNEAANLVGPIVYRKGNFALITSFKEANGVTTKTVAVGKAPLMEGQKTAVSMALTKEGAELLWESFKSDTPDISLVFDMEFAGVRKPYEATLEADWAQVSKSQRISAGFKYKWFGADVDMLFQELRQTGAVKITTKGSDANMDSIIQSANAKLLNVMFDSSGADELKRFSQEKGYENLDRAAKLLKEGANSRKAKASYYQPELNINLEKFSAAIASFFVPSAYAETKTKEQLLLEARELFKKAQTQYSKQDYTGAVKLAKQADAQYQSLKGMPSVGSNWVMAKSYYQLENYDEAIKYFKIVIDTVPRIDHVKNKQLEGPAHVFIAECIHYKKGSKSEAVSYLEAAPGLPAQDFHQMHAHIGEVYELLGEKIAAYKAYKVAISGLSETHDAGIQARKRAKELATQIYGEARKQDGIARSSNYKIEPTQKALAAYQNYKQIVEPTGQREKDVDGRIRMLTKKLKDAGVEPSTAGSGSGDSHPTTSSVPSSKAGTNTAGKGAKKGTEKKSDSAMSDVNKALDGSASSGSKGSIKADKPKSVTEANKTKPAKKPSSIKPPKKKPTLASKARKSGFPGFSLVASYKLRKIKRSGKLKYELNHYRNEMQAFAMAENIGALYKDWGDDSTIFRAVNIDDPVFKQRDILVTLDGQDATNFGKHINFVTVQMKKLHQSGDLTTDEVVITPNIFNDKNNSFMMTYGWKGDDDRNRWVNYQYRTTWSFHGGIEIKGEWGETDSAVLALKPPHTYRSISIEGVGQALQDAKVRHAVVKITSYVNEKPIVTQTTVRNIGIAPSTIIDIPEGRDLNSKLDITWYLVGGKKIKAKTKELEGDIVYWDELPGA
ncbi:MAG: tetratricopeptide repeat protein [Gammaproteobacteria bacterium]|nr:MAG: tetratricopeptide repeat protein [Gammaproteobacteria bacterium]